MESRSRTKAKRLLYKAKASIVGKYDVVAIQQELDDFASNHEEKLNNDKYVLYELQAYIHFAKGEDKKAKDFIEDANKLKPKSKKFIDPLGNILLTTGIDEFTNLNVPPTKFGGWLTLQGLGWLLSPLFIIGQIGENNSFQSEIGELSAQGERYFTVINSWNYFLLLAFLVVAVFFFSKKKEFPLAHAIFWGVVVVMNIFVSIYLAGILNSIGETSLAGEQFGSIFTVLVGAAIWVPYYYKSVRVKGTFLR